MPPLTAYYTFAFGDFRRKGLPSTLTQACARKASATHPLGQIRNHPPSWVELLHIRRSLVTSQFSVLSQVSHAALPRHVRLPSVLFSPLVGVWGVWFNLFLPFWCGCGAFFIFLTSSRLLVAWLEFLKLFSCIQILGS